MHVDTYRKEHTPPMGKPKPATVPHAPRTQRIPDSVIREADALAASAAVEAAAKRKPRKPSERERLASALLQQWLSYRSDLGQASADHFYALRYYTALFLGADHKRIICRRPDGTRREV